MSISMNVHNVASIKPGEIKAGALEDGSQFYWRNIDFFDAKGACIFSVTTHTDNGYSLMITDSVIDEMNTELPLLKAA